MSKKEKSTTKKTKKSNAWHWASKLFTILLRTLLFVVMFVFLLGGVSWVAISHMFNAQQISQAMTYQLQKVFNRPVIISSLDLKFLNTVELKGFAVLDNEVQPGEEVVSAESVLIRYQLLPLLDHELIIDEVTLQKPRISVLRAENGIYNVPPVKMSEAQPTYVNEQTGQKWQIRIEDWRIRNGVMSYKDLKSGASHAIYGLNMHFRKLRFNDWSDFRLETVLRNQWGDNISDLEIRGHGQINFADFRWSKFGLRNFKTHVAVFRKPVSVTVDLENLRQPAFSLQAKVPAFDQQDLSVFKKDLPVFSVPASTLFVKGNLNDTYTHLTLEESKLHSDLTSVTASGEIDFASAPLTADITFKTDSTDLNTLSKHWPALNRFKLSGQSAASGNYQYNKNRNVLPQLELTAKNVTGDFWGFKTKDVNGQFIAKKNFTDLYAKTTSGQVQVADTVFDELKMTGSYRNDDVYAYISSALLNQVPLKLRLSINKIKKATRTIDTSIYLKHFDPMAFIGVVADFVDVILAIPEKPSAPTPLQTGELAWMRNFRDRLPTFMPNFSGTLYADTFGSSVLSGKRFNAEFALTGLLPGAADLDGTLDMKLEDGIIHQMEKVAEEQEALSVTYTPFIMLHRMESSGSFKVGEVLKDVAFEEMAVSTDFKKGTMIINNAFTQGPIISAAVSGWADWVRETFELVIWTMITPSSRRGVLAENLTDENGNPALSFKVSSSMLKPKLEMLRAKKTNEQITAARARGLRTNFTKSKEFVKGEFNAKK